MTEKNVTTVSSYEQCDCKNFPANIEKVKSLKPDYPSILSHLLNLALNDSDLLKKCI